MKVFQSQGSRMGEGRQRCCSAVQDEAGVVERGFLPRHTFHGLHPGAIKCLGTRRLPDLQGRSIL